ncbi:hypothetical protein ACX27_17365 [Nostoc piscinale CENA21]|uniref:Uncharacterized protein n=1 Tax=Nostoc piscinale CENA21 TaxID=224013 RepID=A0A0M5MHA4_9NOSO|nr:hypothetical protein ACX27_17365 [Nostoc piscinale CENA21]
MIFIPILLFCLLLLFQQIIFVTFAIRYNLYLPVFYLIGKFSVNTFDDLLTKYNLYVIKIIIIICEI